MVRVLHVVTHMNRGGLETMIMNYYRAIDKTKIQFDFLTHRPEKEKKDYDSEITRLGGRIYHIRRLNPFSYIYYKELTDFFLKHPQYKVIHVHQDCLSSVILKVAKKCGVEVRIAHCHSSSQDYNFYYPIKMYFKRKIKRYATQMIACGERAGRWMFGKNAVFTILPNAIDTDKYIFSENKREKVRNDLTISNTDIVLGHVGRFSPVKNHYFLIDIINELVKKNINVKLVLVGDGELFDSIQKKVELLRLSNNVVFLGLRNDVNDLLQAFDLFIMPSLYEGLPVSIIEAQAAGLRCIISERVPIECDITGNVYQLDLNDGAQKWAKEIIKLQEYKRLNMKKVITEANYDISGNTKVISEIYLENCEE